MKKALSAHGNGWELHIDKPILMLLGYNPPATRALLTMKNKILYIRDIDDKEGEKLKSEGKYVKKFLKRGGGWAIPLPLAIFELCGINPEKDMVELEVNENILTVKKHKG